MRGSTSTRRRRNNPAPEEEMTTETNNTATATKNKKGGVKGGGGGAGGMKKRSKESPEEVAARRRERERDRTRARRAKLRESLPSEALAQIRAKNYEAALKKRYQNDDKPYNGPDAVAGETIGDRRRRLEAQRVRERRRLKKMNQSQSADKPQAEAQPQNKDKKNDNTAVVPVEDKIKRKLHSRIISSIYTSIQTPEEKELIHDVKCGKSAKKPSPQSETSTSTHLTAREAEEAAFRRFFVAQLESDFTSRKRSLASTALELELGPKLPTSVATSTSTSTSLVPDQGQRPRDQKNSTRNGWKNCVDEFYSDSDDVVVKMEPESSNEDEDDQGTVQDWLARMYSSETEQEQEEPDSEDDEEEFSVRPTTTPTPQQLQEQHDKISELKLKCSQRARAKQLGQLQSLVEAARRRWVEEAGTPDDDAIRFALDSEREAMIERIYAEKHTLITAAQARLAEKGLEYGKESEQDRKDRILTAYKAVEEESKVKSKSTTNKRVTTSTTNKASDPASTSTSTPTPEASPPKPKTTPARDRLPLDDSAKSEMAEKSRIRNKMTKAESLLYSSLLHCFSSYPHSPEGEATSMGVPSSPTDAALSEFEGLLTSRDAPRVIQFWALVRTTKDKYPEEVLTYRRMLHSALSLRLKEVLERPKLGRRVDTTPILPLYKKLYPEEETAPSLESTLLPPPPPLEPGGGGVAELTPVTPEQSLRDFKELRELIQKCEGGVGGGGGLLGTHLRPQKKRKETWTRIKSDPARHEHLLALKRRWHQRKKNGVELELGTYLTVPSGKGRRMMNSKGRKEGGSGDGASSKKRVKIPKTKLPKGPRIRKKRTTKKKKNTALDYGYEPFILQQQQQQMLVDPYSGMERSGTGDGGTHPHSYAGSTSHGQEDQDDDYEFGWLPMGTGVQPGGLLPSTQLHQQKQNQLQGPNYFQLQPSSSHSRQHNHHPQFFHDPTHHLHQVQQQQQGTVWNLSNHPQSQQQLNPYPTSHLEWNPGYSNHQNQSAASPVYSPDDDDLRNDSSDSEHAYFPPSFSQGRKIGRGRPRKGMPVRRKSKVGATALQTAKKRSGSAPILLAADAQPPPPNRMDTDPTQIGMDPVIIQSILPKCPHCEEFIIGPVELEKHITKMHPQPQTPPPTESAAVPGSTPKSTTPELGVAVAVAQKPRNNSSSQSNPEGVDVKFSCKTCSAQFADPLTLISHILFAHYPGKQYQCPIGRRIMTNGGGGDPNSSSQKGGRRCAREDARYERHGLRVHLPLVHPEEIRGTWIMGINAARVAEKATKFLCLQCDETTPTYTDLCSHYASTHGRTRYVCEYCGILLREDDFWLDHSQIFHPQENVQTPPQSVQIDQDKVFTCSICYSEFSSQPFLAAHVAEGHTFLGEKGVSVRKETDESGSKEPEPEEEEEERNDGQGDGQNKKKKGKLGSEAAAAPYKCEICPRSYLSLGCLRVHSIRRHQLHKYFQRKKDKGLPTPTASEETTKVPELINDKVHLPTTPTPNATLEMTDPTPTPTSTYSCHLCPYSTPSSSSFHGIHLGYDAYLKRTCPLCQKSFDQPYLLHQHAESDHGAETAASIKSSLSSLPPSGLVGGTRPKGLYPEQWLSCGVCSRGFTHQEFHTYHTLSSQGLGAIGCKASGCSQLFPSRYLLRKHMTEEHSGLVQRRPGGGGGAQAPKPHPQPRSLQEEDYAKLIISTEVPKFGGSSTLFTCKVCLKSWKTEGFIRTHISVAHKEDAFSRVFCAQCNSTFSCRDNLRKHEKVVHSDQNIRFRCPSCPAVFGRMHKLKRHSKGEHPGQGFNVKDVIRFRAEGEEPVTAAAGAGTGGGAQLRCDICSATFTTKVAMKRHVTQQHFSIHINTFCERCGLQLHPSTMARHAQRCKSEEEVPETPAVPVRKSVERLSKSGEKRLSIHQVLENVAEVYERMELAGIKFRQSSASAPTKARGRNRSSKEGKVRVKKVKVIKPRKKSVSLRRSLLSASVSSSKNKRAKGGGGAGGRGKGRRRPVAIVESETETDDSVPCSDDSTSDEDENIARLSMSHETRIQKERLKSTSTSGGGGRGSRSASKSISTLNGKGKSGEEAIAGNDEDEGEDKEWDWGDDMIIKQEISDIGEDEFLNEGVDGVVDVQSGGGLVETNLSVPLNPYLLWSDSSPSSSEMEVETSTSSKRGQAERSGSRRQTRKIQPLPPIPCREFRLVLQRCDDVDFVPYRSF